MFKKFPMFYMKFDKNKKKFEEKFGTDLKAISE